ncbi:MAG: twin-arginine translocase subunit TatC [Bryobacteraceae bacterium]
MPDEPEEPRAPDSKAVHDETELVETAGPQPPSTPVYSSSSDPYGYPGEQPQPLTASHSEAIQELKEKPAPPAAESSSKGVPPPPPTPPPEDDEDQNPEERGMLRMSFMGHLEELRSRLLKAIMGLAVAFLASMFFAKDLWNVVQEPAVDALRHIGAKPAHLVYITPMEAFNIIWLKMPLLVSLFLGSPWVLYQVWAFISPGLYRRERRWAVPFILCTAGLFIAGGCFAYFVAFRYGLEFLLGIGLGVNVAPMISINYYFDLFVNVTLGVGLVFEMPVIIFFLTLLRLASPRFLLRHSRYAILGITIIAAVVTPTPDVFNMMIFAVPMVMLYFVGLFASYLLVLRREGKSFPWRIILLAVLALILLSAGVLALFIYRYHYHFIQKWPYFTK